MRISVISSVVSTVVARVNDRLVAAGLAMRTLLNHTSMREQHSGWHEPRVLHGVHNFTVAGCSWPRLSKRSGQRALALCPAYAAIARVSPRS